MPLSSLSENALDEILNDLPEPFTSLPPIQRLELCAEINGLWYLYRNNDPALNGKAPHKLLSLWKQIKATIQKFRQLTDGFESAMAFEIDFINNGQQRVTCGPYEVREELPWIGNIGELFAKRNLIVPSLMNPLIFARL